MDAPTLDELADRLGIVIGDPELVGQALVHSSFHNENPDAASGHNERLEFFGDAVIGVIVSRLLYDRYPLEDEGFLTARRAALVNREALAVLALDLGLDRHLKLGRGESEAGGASRPSVLAAAFEALAGALWLSDGHEATAATLARLFEPQMDVLAGLEGPLKSPKSRLQEWTQRHRGLKPVYRLVTTNGPPHEQEFEVAVLIDGERLGGGVGTSRQRAEEQAAEAALELLLADAEAVERP